MRTVAALDLFERPVANAGEAHHELLAWGLRRPVRRRLTEVKIWISDLWSNRGEQNAKRRWLRE